MTCKRADACRPDIGTGSKMLRQLELEDGNKRLGVSYDFYCWDSTCDSLTHRHRWGCLTGSLEIFQLYYSRAFNESLEGYSENGNLCHVNVTRLWPESLSAQQALQPWQGSRNVASKLWAGAVELYNNLHFFYKLLFLVRSCHKTVSCVLHHVKYCDCRKVLLWDFATKVCYLIPLQSKLLVDGACPFALPAWHMPCLLKFQPPHRAHYVRCSSPA